jgi:hypothetical protein
LSQTPGASGSFPQLEENLRCQKNARDFSGTEQREKHRGKLVGFCLDPISLALTSHAPIRLE